MLYKVLPNVIRLCFVFRIATSWLMSINSQSQTHSLIDLHHDGSKNKEQQQFSVLNRELFKKSFKLFTISIAVRLHLNLSRTL
jgi:hypothetical protein